MKVKGDTWPISGLKVTIDIDRDSEGSMLLAGFVEPW